MAGQGGSSSRLFLCPVIAFLVWVGKREGERMSNEDVLFFCMTYGVIGLTLGFLELVIVPAYEKNFLCRRYPLVNVALQIVIWPITYFIINRFLIIQKSIKIAIVFSITFFLQKKIVVFLIPYVGLFFSSIIAIVLTFLSAQFLFGIFEIPELSRKRYLS